jgi:2-polyprenyl-3-methyl-5-hydroxy-6-metoxy-1,4-benzoquinol methylase
MKWSQRINRLRNVFFDLEHFLDSDGTKTKVSIGELGQVLDLVVKNAEVKSESDYLFLRISDISRLLIQDRKVNWRIETNRPVAIDSNDHIHPRGVKQDETRKPAFVSQLINLYGPNVSYLDLGCAGGGLVYDFILRECLAVGIEGSDYSKNHSRAYWQEVPWALHTADLTAPLNVFLENEPAVFDVIGAWEFFEHIEEKDIPAVLQNVKNHLKRGTGLFLANIATFEDSHEGTHWHRTIREKEWWVDKFTNLGFEVILYPFASELNPRGSGNTFGTWGNDYDISTNPNLGFNIAAKLK